MNVCESVTEALERNGVILKGHFKLTSGNHSDTYIQKDLIHHFPETYALVRNALEHLSGEFRYDAVTGPAIAGAVIARDIATSKRVPFVYPEKIDGKMVFRRGHDRFINGKRLLIVEDIITTGKSVKQTVDAVSQCGGVVIGVVAIWNRSGWNILPTNSIVNQTVEHFSPEDCPLCKNDIPLEDPKK